MPSTSTIGLRSSRLRVLAPPEGIWLARKTSPWIGSSLPGRRSTGETRPAPAVARLCRGDHSDLPGVPILLLVNREEDFPQFILLILDAQNAKGAWSLRSVRQDTPVFLVLFSDSTTVQQACLHEGFAASGKSPGRFVPGSPESLDELVAKFRLGHL